MWAYIRCSDSLDSITEIGFWRLLETSAVALLMSKDKIEIYDVTTSSRCLLFTECKYDSTKSKHGINLWRKRKTLCEI